MSVKIKDLVGETIFLQEEKRFTFKVNGEEIVVNKWWEDENSPWGHGASSDYEIVKGQEYIQNLSSEEYEEVIEYIEDLD